MDIIDVLVKTRKAQRVSQETLTTRIGCHTHLSRWELKHHSPRLDNLMAWANTLGFDLVLQPRVKL